MIFGNNMKTVLMTIKDKTKLPYAIKKSIKEMKENNPDYIFYLYDDADLERIMKEEFSEYWEFYDIFSDGYFVLKIDLFRYLWINKYGGIYLDVKSHIKGKFEEFFDFGKDFEVFSVPANYKLFYINRNGMLYNGCFMSKPNSEFLKKVIDEFVENVKWEYPKENRPYEYVEYMSLWGSFMFTKVYWAFVIMHRIHEPEMLNFNRFVYSVFNETPDSFQTTHRKIIKSSVDESMNIFKDDYLLECI